MKKEYQCKNPYILKNTMNIDKTQFIFYVSKSVIDALFFISQPLNLVYS